MPQVLQINIPKLTAAITSALMPPDVDDEGVKKAVGKTASKLANAISSEIQPIFAAMNQSIDGNVSVADDLTEKIEEIESKVATLGAGASAPPGV